MSFVTSIDAVAGSTWSRVTGGVGGITDIGAHDGSFPYGPNPVTYVHDFGTGPFTLTFNLHASGLNNSSPPMTPTNGMVGTTKLLKGNTLSERFGYCATLLDQGVEASHLISFGNPAGFQVNYTNVYATDGLSFTRTNLYAPSDPNANSILGPYTVSYTTPGEKPFNIVLYWGDHGTGSSNQVYIAGPVSSPTSLTSSSREYTGNTGIYTTNAANTGSYYDMAKFELFLVQKSVSIIEVVGSNLSISTGGTIGPGVIPSSTTIIGMDTLPGNNTVTLTNVNSRQMFSDAPMATSLNNFMYWTIELQDPFSGIWNSASPGVDFSLGGGQSLSSQQIDITWVTSGSFRVTNIITGEYVNPVVSGYFPPSSGTLYPNNDSSVVFFDISTDITNTYTFPFVAAIVTPVSAYNNTVLTTTPVLEGVEAFSVIVSPQLNTSAASYTQQINVGPVTTIPLTDAQWLVEMENRTTVVCQVKKAGTSTVLQQASGFGPHTFILNHIHGSYDVGYTMS